MVMVVLVVLVVLMMVSTSIGGLYQISVQVGGDEGVHRPSGLPGHHLDTVLGEDGQCSLADTAHDNHLNAMLPQPAREQARFVLGSRQRLGSQDGFGPLIDLNQRKVSAPAEV